MDFLDLVKPNLCHSRDSIQLVKDDVFPKLKCNVCDSYPITNIYEFILQPTNTTDYFKSSILGQAYYQWTRDENTQVSFALTDLEGILDVRIKGQSLISVYETVQILKAMNEPFTNRPQTNNPKVTNLMKNFISKYLEKMSLLKIKLKHNQPKSNTMNKQWMIDNVFSNLHQIMSSKEFPNPFELYFQKLVPYVLACKGSETSPILVTDFWDNETNLVKQLNYQLEKSEEIRKNYGMYSIPFCTLHVIMNCYVTTSNWEVMYNFLLDFFARICNGNFFWKKFEQCNYVKAIKRVVERETAKTKNRDFFYVVKAIENDNGIESLSQLLPKYLQLEKIVHEKLLSNSNDDILEYAISQLFPAVLFKDQASQMGFTLAFAHVASKMNQKTGEIKKKTFKHAREIYRFVKRFMIRIKDFDSSQTMLWTWDTFEMFLAFDKEIDNDICILMNLLLDQDE